MNNHYWNQTVFPQAFPSTNNEQYQSNYHWGYNGGSNSAYFGSYPWVSGVGGAVFPIYTTSASYPSSSSTTLQADSGTGGATVNTSTNANACASDQSQSVVLKEEREHGPSPFASADLAARFLETIPVPHVVESRERAEPTQDSPRLASLDLRELDANEAVFYFGVLAIQSLLLPRFQYSQDQSDRKWGCTLTMYGHTIVKPHLFDSQGVAKAEACREALKTLVSQFPEWIVPREPEESPVAFVGWSWVELLQDYCVHNGLRQPHYTQYTHENNYRHEVELESGSFFGLQKKYSDVQDSRNAAAHMGLHGLLVFGNGVPYSFPGPFTLKRSNETLLAHVPRQPAGDRADTSITPCHCSTVRGVKRGSSDDHYASGSPPRGRNKKARTRGGRRAKGGSASKESVISVPSQCKNANLLPLGENRLPDLEIHEPEEKRRWHLTPGQIQDRIKNLWTQNARLESKIPFFLCPLHPSPNRVTLISFHDWKGVLSLTETCQLLSLQRPEISVERTDGRLVEGEGEYSAAAYFQGDPFLTRAGAIGSIKGVHQSQMAARESCAGEVVKYLLRMVNEDTILEEEEAAKREQPDQWRENIVKVYAKQGILSPEAFGVSE